MSEASLDPWPFPDPELGDREELFKRFKNEHWANGIFSGLGLSFSTPPSFNRSKFSSPKDVLVDGQMSYAEWGVIACFVADVEEEVLSGEGVLYRFHPVHKPELHNYAHSEVAHVPNPDCEPTRAVKKQFRAMLGRRMRLITPSSV